MRWERERAELALVFDRPTRQPVGFRTVAPAGTSERCAAAGSLFPDVLSLPTVSGRAEPRSGAAWPRCFVTGSSRAWAKAWELAGLSLAETGERSTAMTRDHVRFSGQPIGGQSDSAEDGGGLAGVCERWSWKPARV